MTAQETNPALDILCIVLTIYWIILFVRVIVSWAYAFRFRPPVSGPVRGILDLLEDVTEPVLSPIRRIVPPAGPLDLSVLVAFVIIFVLRSVFC